MKFWAIAYKYEEDAFYDVAAGEDTMSITETCFLPTKELAEQVIENELSVNYVPVEITLLRLEKNGIWEHTRGRVKEWDSYHEEDEE